MFVEAASPTWQRRITDVPLCPNTDPWSHPIIIGTFCGFAGLVVAFVVWEWKFAGPTSILPLRFFRNRTQVGACLEAFFLMFVLLLGTYYLPVWVRSRCFTSRNAC